LNVWIVGTLALAGGCRGTEPPAPPAPNYTTTATIKDLMLSIIDTNADVVWLSVSSVFNEKGVIETAPKTEEDWIKVRHGAIALAEASNLLMIPGRRVARPGEKSETPGVELEPEEMDVLINKDRAAWNKHAADLHTAAVDALQAIDARSPEKVFEVGERIERACEGCHTQYWYPNEKPPELQVSSTDGARGSNP
jgi:hypothetical protein